MENEEDQNADTEYAVNADEMISMESFFYYAKGKELPPDQDPNIAIENVINTDVEHLDNLNNYNTHQEIFYKRLVSLLMSNILIKEDDDIVTGIVMIQTPYKKMELLKNLHDRKVSLRELDAILSEAIKKPDSSYLENIVYSLQCIYNFLYIITQFVHNNFEMTIILLTAVLAIIITRRLKFHRGLSLCAIIQILFVISFLMTWWKLVQDAEIKLTVKQMQYSKIPISCQPHKMTTWDRITTMFSSTDDCQQYYEAIMSNPKLQITPAIALSHFLSTIILHPLSNVGHALSAFVNNATAELSWTYAWIMKIVLLVLLCCGIIVIPICLNGGSINFGLGPLLRFGLHGRNSDTAKSVKEGGEKREPVQLILQIHHDGKQVSQSLTNVSEAEKPTTAMCLTHKEEELNDNEGKNALLANKKNLLQDQEAVGAGDGILVDKCQKAITESGEECKKDKNVEQMEELGGGDFTAVS
ncbi:hypothetical protein KM043_012611 [Ampulex compressa]|nr:hypothetical protein KM043_012611 [Ampulex compressa]